MATAGPSMSVGASQHIPVSLFARRAITSFRHILMTFTSKKMNERFLDVPMAPERQRSQRTYAAWQEQGQQSNLGQSKASTLLVVGDVHNQWGDEDETAIEFINPDMVVFVGDIGNEDVDLIQRIGSYTRHRKVVVLGNHDAWYSLTSRGRQRAIKAALQSSSLKRFSGNLDAVLESLHVLGDCHIGYSSVAADDLGLVFAGARPFSKGGMHWDTVADFYKKYYNINSMEESMSKMLESFLDEEKSEYGLVVVAHNGPSGLGQRPEDPCGIDFMEPADDFGDPDLEEALEVAASCGRCASLVLFGHMHHRLKKGGYRNMVAVDDTCGTVYLNAAVVPRTKKIDPGDDPTMAATSRHFVKVTMVNGYAQEASNLWVSVPRAHDVASCSIAENHVILKRSLSLDDPGKSIISYYKAHSDEWDQVIV